MRATCKDFTLHPGTKKACCDERWTRGANGTVQEQTARVESGDVPLAPSGAGLARRMADKCAAQAASACRSCSDSALLTVSRDRCGANILMKACA